MTCKGQIAEQNANEHVLAIAPQGNLQLSPNFFWNFSHHIRMFLTLRQGFLTIFWIFQTGLMYSKPNLNIRLSVYPKYLMIPSTDLSKNFHSSFFSLSPLPVKFWWGLVENCKFFISKFTIFKRVFQNLKIFQKKSEIWVRKTGGVFRGQIWKNALFWKSRSFQFFLS